MSAVSTLPPRLASPAMPSVAVNAPVAAAGFDSPRIIYVRKPQLLEYFAHSEWVDTPARLLKPLVAASLTGSGAFRAVVSAPTAANADWRLDTEIVRLQQEFTGSPSRVRFTLRATLVDAGSRRVLAQREFDRVVVAMSDDPYGGVVATHQVVQGVLGELTTFCAEAARVWQQPQPDPQRSAVGEPPMR